MAAFAPLLSPGPFLKYSVFFTLSLKQESELKFERGTRAGKQGLHGNRARSGCSQVA